MGFPTQRPGTWIPPQKGNELKAVMSDDDPFLLQCYSSTCAMLPKRWKKLARAGAAWADIQHKEPECNACKAERQRRCRLTQDEDTRVLEEPFLSAPYVHQFNQPKYHAMLLRSVEWAKRASTHPQQILWIRAMDMPYNYRDIGRTAEERDKKLTRFLQFHDQRTAGIPGLLPLYKGLRVRATEK